MMPIVDDYSRECLTMEVQRSITTEDVVRTLAALFEQRGEPSFIRSDNGPEFIAQAVKQWLEISGIKTLYIPLHPAGLSLGECLLGDVHKPLFGRATKEGGVH